MKIHKALALLAIAVPAIAQAWWNKDWKERTQVDFNTSSAGVETKETVADLMVPVRLHSGNFDFLTAKADGSDLRVVAGDDKTPLKYWVERFDGSNELAVVWVLLPSVLPGTDKNTIYVYGGNDQAPAETTDAASVADPSLLAAFHFAEKTGIAADQTGTIKAAAATTIEPNGLIGPSARLVGSPIVWPGGDKLRAPAGGPYSLSLWLKPTALQGTLLSQGPLQLALNDGKLVASLGGETVQGGELPSGAWANVALTIGAGKLSLYLNGASVGQADLGAGAPAIAGDLKAGDGYQGLLDELELANTVRSGDWLKLAYAAQSADAKLIASKTQTQDTAGEEESGSQSYFGILFKNLTPDGWAVIGLLMVMFVVAVAVMIGKALMISRTEKANRQFLRRYREAKDVLGLGRSEDGGAAAAAPAALNNSPLYRLYNAGLRELTKRDIGNAVRLSGAALDAVKASIDSDMVRETNRLNSRMVLLTIAIAGGPFLGLLGTVVGVMITFAAIAAAGDVNVNAIAPGIAAALLATVAGLSVAIPSLFGYNYLSSRIKVISSDMQIFVDEFVTRVAELYGAH